MARSVFVSAAAFGAAALVATAGGAKPVKKARAFPAQPPVATTEVAPAAIPGLPVPGAMTPKDVVLRPTTPAEAEANAVWSTRAALNIAALQCQFSPFLATVRNYNDFLRQHADELDRARATMIAHFKRYDGTQAQNSFDRYTTQTYNSYSTLDAQYSFCEAAATAGRTALTLRKGELGRRAASLRDRLRTALVPTPVQAFFQPGTLTTAAIPPL